MDQFLQQLVNGLAIGGIYALVALGYTMVYGVLKLINFAHGDLFTIGAYLGMTLFVSMGLAGKVPAWAAVALVAVMVSVMLERACTMAIWVIWFIISLLYIGFVRSWFCSCVARS